MMAVGAVITVYEDSGFLSECVQRIYPLVDKLLFLVNTVPWRGTGGAPIATLAHLASLPDPGRKFMVVHQYWESEAAQRNAGLSILHNLGIEWCFTVDDDELYNRVELARLIAGGLHHEGVHCLFILQQLYWHNRSTIFIHLDGTPSLMPQATFVRTDPTLIRFSENRCIQLLQGVYLSIFPETIVCHHLAYVRPDEKMRSKIAHSSHANEIRPDWFELAWLPWSPGDPIIAQDRDTIKLWNNTVAAATSRWQLEELPTSLAYDIR